MFQYRSRLRSAVLFILACPACALNPLLPRASHVFRVRIGMASSQHRGEQSSAQHSNRNNDSIRPFVVLVRGKARLFREGEIVVYGGAVSQVSGKGARVGTLVDVADGAGTVIGWGTYNPESMFRVRLLWHHASDGPFPESAASDETMLEKVRT